LTYLSDQNLYNPVAQWITSREWDGQHRLADLFATVTARNELTNPDTKSLKETLIKRWMVSAVAAAFSPTGVSAHGVLVFQGDQYLGKTKWFKTLIPADLGLLKDGMLLRPDDKDSVKQICSYWLVELGELDSTFRKSDIAALKAFITNDSDVLRRAYARKESKFARRTVFFGSVNPREFLHDPTGNRRYWTIECERLDHSHTLDMQQVWAEVYALYQAGEGYYLTPNEMDQLNGHNQEFTSIDPVEERIQSGLDWDLPESLWRWDQVTALLVDAGFDRPTRGDVSAAANIIRKLNTGQSKTIKGKRLLFAPPKRM
jgi:putative DNA primase/helicase